ncbi:hypothetical protein PENSPDRAFT_579937, partial [Peniophora sp. CONT]
LTLGQKDKLKLTFQVVADEAGVQPHQAFVRFYDATTGEEGVQPVKVGPNGKAKFELDMARPFSSLPPSGDAPLAVSLILGSFIHDPARFELFNLAVPPSAPVAPHPDATAFALRPEITHTFRADPKVPPKFISATFAGLVFAPWVVLLGLWGAVRPSVPRLFSPSILPFTLCLAGMEGILFWYWLDLRLGQVLLYGFLMAIPTVFTGKSALASISSVRTGIQ